LLTLSIIASIKKLEKIKERKQEKNQEGRGRMTWHRFLQTFFLFGATEMHTQDSVEEVQGAFL